MKNLCLLSMTLMFVLFSTSCKKRCYDESDIVSETRNMGAFKHIKVKDAISVEIKKGDSYDIEIDANSHLIKLLKTEIKDNCLVIDYKRNYVCNHTKDQTKIVIYVPEINDLDISGASEVYINDTMNIANGADLEFSGASKGRLLLTGSSISIDVSGASDLDIKGVMENIKADVSGASDVNLEFMEVSNYKIDLSGASKMTVGSPGKIEGDVSGSSTLFYKSAGTLIVDNSGASTVSQY